MEQSNIPAEVLERIGDAAIDAASAYSPDHSFGHIAREYYRKGRIDEYLHSLQHPKRIELTGTYFAGQTAVKWQATAQSFEAIKALGCHWQPGPMGENTFSVKVKDEYVLVRPNDWVVRLPLKEGQKIPGTYNSWLESPERPDFVVLREYPVEVAPAGPVWVKAWKTLPDHMNELPIKICDGGPEMFSVGRLRPDGTFMDIYNKNFYPPDQIEWLDNQPSPRAAADREKESRKDLVFSFLLWLDQSDYVYFLDGNLFGNVQTEERVSVDFVYDLFLQSNP